jgi:hypothetical protein
MLGRGFPRAFAGRVQTQAAQYMHGHQPQIGNVMHALHLGDVRIGRACSDAKLVQLLGDGAAVVPSEVHRSDALDVWPDVAVVAALRIAIA